jgi:LmbE family N-acetylglucosaminyl deacetylase
MIHLNFKQGQDAKYKVLLLGAHSDDIEIGCGGTILRLIEEYPNLSFYWVVLGSNKKERTEEALQSANDFLAGAKDKKIVVKGFRDGYFPYIGGEVKDYFEQLKGEISPDLIFTHYRSDRHQDHRLVSDLTWNTFRDHFILEYEIPKYDGDLGVPNLFFHLSEPICQKKIGHILTHFKTQSERFWFTEETFLSLLRIRGVESRTPEKYAEAFYCRKLVL